MKALPLALSILSLTACATSEAPSTDDTNDPVAAEDKLPDDRADIDDSIDPGTQELSARKRAVLAGTIVDRGWAEDVVIAGRSFIIVHDADGLTTLIPTD